MKKRTTLYSKMNIAISIFIIITLVVYGILNQMNVQVVERLLQNENSNQLEFLRKQMDATAYTLAMNTISLSRDPSVLELEKALFKQDEKRVIQTESIVQEKLHLQSSSSSWFNEISLSFPAAERTITTGINQIFSVYDEVQLERSSRQSGWIYMPANSEGGEAKFIYTAGGPINDTGRIDQSIVIVQMSVNEKTVSNLLDQLKSGSKGDPFMINNKKQVVYNETSDFSLTDAVIQALDQEELQERGTMQTKLHNKTYIVNYVYSQALDFYMVDYTPIQQILAPITMSRNLFYGCIGLLLLLGFLASFFMYKNVQQPLKALTGVLKKIQTGDFNTRINRWYHNEFDYITVRFNEMAGQIQHLFENVYEERNRSRLATLKMLQAQINPHFLYNSLNFIISSANLGRQESVVAMAYNLSDYYRYMTRLENHHTKLEDELKVIQNYLEIHKLRLQRINYEIRMPEEMQHLSIPRLLIQPIVENALIHGLEPKLGKGKITIIGYKEDGFYWIAVEDNGVGVSDTKLEEIRERLHQQADNESSCGMRNVNMRLKHEFGETAGLRIEKLNDDSSVRVTIYWEGNG
ncbi:histidine kinase [Paenibacillus sp. GXUN7292]|uniref:sensor histidine kinase n=1 Tax=Paenibacillus sp. GXUN7292 TaxID=3422499 RepID=UPI003D7EA2FE